MAIPIDHSIPSLTQGAEDDVVVNMSFPRGRHATFVISTRCCLTNEAIIAGSEGIAKVWTLLYKACIEG